MAQAICHETDLKGILFVDKVIEFVKPDSIKPEVSDKSADCLYGFLDFAVPTLKSLIENKHNVLSVITQPDRPFGRKRIKTAPPVKKFALEHNIPVSSRKVLKMRIL